MRFQTTTHWCGQQPRSQGISGWKRGYEDRGLHSFYNCLKKILTEPGTVLTLLFSNSTLHRIFNFISLSTLFMFENKE